MSSQIEFKLRGADRNNDLVRAGDFVAFLQRLLATLTEIDRAQNGVITRYYQISKLQISSAAATLEEVVDDKHLARRHKYFAIAPAFEQLVYAVSNRERPSWASPDVLVKLRDLADPLNNLSSAELLVKGMRITLDDSYRRNIDHVIGRDIASQGEAIGKLDEVNVHRQYRATLYQAPGEKPISCEFSPALKPDILKNIGFRVRVVGELRRREDSERPYSVKIRSIERLAGEDDLPLFASLIGIAADFPSVDPVDYVRHLRDADA